jgi:hypothetical protein
MTNADGVLDQIDHALHDWDTSGDAMRWKPVPPPVTVDYKRIRVAFQVIGEHVRTQMRAFEKAMRQVAKVYSPFLHQMTAHDRTRCSTCRPYSNPKPLAFGAEYHRRQKRRSRS